jgi:hypothetical protein
MCDFARPIHGNLAESNHEEDLEKNPYNNLQGFDVVSPRIELGSKV